MDGIGKRRGRACPYRLFCGHQTRDSFQNMIGRLFVQLVLYLFKIPNLRIGILFR